MKPLGESNVHLLLSVNYLTLYVPSIAPFNASILGSMVSSVIWNSSFCNMASRRRLYLLETTRY